MLEMLAGITDPRDPRGIRHPLLAVLGVAVVATLAGAANFRELGSVAADLPSTCCGCWAPAGIGSGDGLRRRVRGRCGGC